MDNLTQMALEELTNDEMNAVEGGWDSFAEFAGACVGTVVGSVICISKCVTNYFQITSPKK